MFIKKKKGQSTVEYIILVTAVIAVIIVFVNSNSSLFRRSLNDSYDAATGAMTNMGQRLDTTFNTANGV